MKITYINHSGFLVETENCYYVFDYYKGEMPRLDKSKEVVVFCSHFHQDHFNPKIFEILDDMGMNYQAVLAKDISKKKYPAGVKVTTAYHDQTYTLDNAKWNSHSPKSYGCGCSLSQVSSSSKSLESLLK